MLKKAWICLIKKYLSIPIHYKKFKIGCFLLQLSEENSYGKLQFKVDFRDHNREIVAKYGKILYNMSVAHPAKQIILIYNVRFV